MPYLLIQFIALILWFTVPAIAVIPLWLILFPLYVVILRVLIFVGVFLVAAAVSN